MAKQYLDMEGLKAYHKKVTAEIEKRAIVRELTQAEYDALSPEEKKLPNVIYFITDAEEAVFAIDPELSETSQNAIQNKVVAKGFKDVNEKLDSFQTISDDEIDKLFN